MALKDFVPEWEELRQELVCASDPQTVEASIRLRVAVAQQTSWINVVRDTILRPFET